MRDQRTENNPGTATPGRRHEAETERGIWALKISFIGLMATAAVQAAIVALSGSVALLADTLHNISDALTALPLWLAFSLSRRSGDRRFTYGYHRTQDLAGLGVLFFIALSGVVAGREAYLRLLEPRTPAYLWVAIGAGFLGFLGNEAVAQVRIRTGRAIGSAALVADGQHSRLDGLSSLGVVIGLVGVSLGYPIADPIAALAITGIIGATLFRAGKEVLLRLLDAIEPGVIRSAEGAAKSVDGVRQVHDLRGRWVGHEILLELTIDVDSQISVREGHRIAEQVRHQLFHRVDHLLDALIHIDPVEAVPGEEHRLVEAHLTDRPHPEPRE